MMSFVVLHKSANKPDNFARFTTLDSDDIIRVTTARASKMQTLKREFGEVREQNKVGIYHKMKFK